MNVVIIGDSITEGAGASNYEYSYVYRLEKYLKEEYEDLRLLNLGASGTASNFALYRLKRDLEGFKPDIILLEFAVNDRIYSSVDSSIYFEGLVRACLEYTRNIVILDMPTGTCDACTTIHKKIAYFYNIPVIDVQDIVWKKIGDREITWTKISIDNLHPNDKGHELYFEIIKTELDKINLMNIESKCDYRVISKYRFVNPSLVEYSNKQIEYYGSWKEKAYNLNNKFKYGAITYNVGDAVIFKFKGKCLAMMNLLSRDSGKLLCQLDGQYEFYIDLFIDSDGRFETTINLTNLKNIEHTLTIVIDKEKNPKSIGNKAVIGGFLIDPGN